MSETTKSFTADDARTIGEEIGIDWATSPFDVEQLRIGMNVELEHGLHDPLTKVTDDDPHVTANTATLLTWSPAELMLVATTEAGATTTPTRAGIV